MSDRLSSEIDKFEELLRQGMMQKALTQLQEVILQSHLSRSTGGLIYSDYQIVKMYHRSNDKLRQRLAYEISLGRTLYSDSLSSHYPEFFKLFKRVSENPELTKQYRKSINVDDVWFINSYSVWYVNH